VGEECKFMKKGNTALIFFLPEFVNENFVVGTTSGNYALSLERQFCTFYQIPTKADDELYNLVLIIEDCYESGISATAKEIQQAGFTIPKKIKRSDIENTILAKFCNSHVIRCYLVTAICDLLGDLVEQDKGGAE
jgi:hypothetical protein